MHNDHDLTHGPLGRQILEFSVPLIFSNLLQVVFNMSDIAVVGRFAGTLALGAVGSTAILVTLFTGFLIGVGAGINVVAAHFLGADRAQDIRETVGTAFLLSALTGLVVMAAAELLTVPLLSVIGTRPELMQGAILYLRIYLTGMPALAFYNYGSAILSAAGDTRRPLFYLTAAGIVNVILNLFFVIVLKIDVAGVAIASIVSEYLSALLVLRALRKEKDPLRLDLTILKPDPAKASMILKLGIPSGFQGAIFAIANLFIQAGVNSFDTVMVAGNSAAVNTDSIVYNAMGAFYTACSSFMGQNYGAGDRDRTIRSFWWSQGYSFATGALLGGLLLAFGRPFLHLFAEEEAVIDAGMLRLRIMCFSYAFSAPMDCTIAASRGLGKSFVPTVIVILGSCVFRVIWVYTVFAHFHTVPSLYLLYIFSWTITAAAELIYFRKIWREMRSGAGNFG